LVTRKAFSEKIIPQKDDSLKFDLGKFAFSLLPLSPESVGRRKTLLTNVVKDSVWTLDQIQGIINVNVPVRCTVIRLSSGGLFVNNPVAPTSECINLIRQLESKYGAVKYITLSSLAIEHKGTAGAFASYFPKSSVYVQPGQYSFPVDLPTELFFPFGKTVRNIPVDSSEAPWFEDIDHQVLGPLRPPGVGGFAETAFFHRASGTVLVTDSIIKVEDEPPAIIQEDPRSILYHSRDTMLQEVDDTPASRRKGWRRMVLFGLFFQPAGIAVKDTFAALKEAKQVSPAVRKLGEGAIPLDGGFYPWDWVDDEEPSFRALQRGSGLLVAPILQTLILNREPERVLQWVDSVCKWPFTRIIPCHFANDIQATPTDFRRAFDFLLEPKTPDNSLLSSLLSILTGPGSNISKKKESVAFKKDIQFLADISQQLTKQGVLFPEAALLPRK